MIPKATEDTITSLLKEELDKRGVQVELIPSIETPVGLRKPDLLCKNGGTYPVEAKFAERDLIQAIAKVQNDYLKHYKALGIKGGFAILYPDILAQPMPLDTLKSLALRSKFKLVSMFPAEDPRPFNVSEALLPEIAEVLADNILKPAKVQEASVDYIIKSLREAAIFLLNGLRDVTSTELEDFFGGKEVFANILQYEEGKYPVEELKSATAYLLVNQLLFYHVLSQQRPEFPEIDSDAISKPEELKQYFDKVLEINYRMVYSYDVASLIPPKFTDEVKTIINVISALGAYKVGGDLLGTIFHDLIPFDVRKKVAAFYTNVLAAELLAFLSIDDYHAKVADFACGSGGLLVSSYRRKRFLLGRPLKQDTHKRFVEDLLGVDVMPFAANIAACHIALQAPQYFTDKVNLAVWDSTDLKPGRSIPSVTDLKMVFTGQTSIGSYTEQKKRREKGVVSLSGKVSEDIYLSKYDVVIMNPPFTRQERMPKIYKEEILPTRFKDYKEYLQGRLGYHGYFMLLADEFLDDGGRMALVLPATVLRIQSFEGIRRLIAENYHVEHIITTTHRSAFSESVAFREMLFIARKGKASRGAKTVMTVLKKLPETITEAREIVREIAGSTENWEDEKLSVRVHDYDELTDDPSNWFKFVALNDLSLIDQFDNLVISSKLIPLHELLQMRNSDVLRGIETSKGIKVQPLTISRPERAVKKNDEWVIKEEKKTVVAIQNRHTAKELTIPLKPLRHALRRVSLVKKLNIADDLDYVIAERFKDLKEYNAASIGKQKNRIKETSWRQWKPYIEGRTSKLAITRRADLSAKGTCLLAFYSDTPFAPPGVAWSIKLDDEESKILALWFNSTLNILQSLIERKETRGAFLQIDEYVICPMKVPDIQKLSKDERKLLIDVFDELEGVEFSGILNQLQTADLNRRKLDTAWLKVLNYRGDADKLLDKLYTSLSGEIELLKHLMDEGAEGEDEDEEED